MTRALRTIMTQLLVFLVHGYQLAISPIIGPSCRLSPSCSAYAIEALQAHGSWRGVRLAVARILRCHPFHAGGFDPVPPVDSVGGPGGP